MMEHDKYLMQELYGHKCQMYNVGAMLPYMDYTPRTLEQIILLSDGWREVDMSSVDKNGVTQTDAAQGM